VINHIYGLCTQTACNDAAAANILLIDADHVNAHDNDVGNAQLNIYQEGDSGKIQNNTIFQSQVFDGIDLVGNNNDAKNNTINDSDEDGVYVAGNGNHVNGNSIDEATNGVENDGGSGNDFTGNHFVNVVNEVVGVGPAPTAKQLAVLAARAASPAQP
jgi:copper-binding protein NosD